VNTEVMMEMAKGVVPVMAAGVVACVLIVLMRKGRPSGDSSACWVGTLLLGLGAAGGAAWAGGEWKPGPSGTTWLPTMALLAGAAGLVRGERERAGFVGWGTRAVALAGAAWMTVRSVADMSDTERVVIIAGLALAGSAVCSGLERSVKEAASKRGGWPGAATGLIVGFAASQVLIIGMEVHAAAWTAAGVSAFFGVCLAVGLVTRRAMVGRGVLAAAGVLLCGLLVHGWQYGNAKGIEVGLYASLLVISAVGPVVAARVMGERGRGWGGVIACAVPAVAAVVLAVIVRPPPLDA
jgi:hypothetical protein